LDPYCSRGAIGRAVWGVFADGVILWFYGWFRHVVGFDWCYDWCYGWACCMVVTEVLFVFFVV